MKKISRAMFLGLLSAASGVTLAADIDQLQKDFQTPPDDARIMVRWWWYGPAVTKDGLLREMTAMKAGNIGGFETIPTYPLVLDGGTGDNAVKNLKWMSPEYLDMLSFTAGKAKEMGMRMDVTLGSGWPYGGPMFAPSDGAKALTTEVVQAAAGQATVKTNSQTAFAAFAGPAGVAIGGGRGGRGGRGGGGGGGADLTAFKPLPFKDGVAQLPADFAGGQVVFFEYRQNIMAVKRPANGADGPVIDHLSANAVDKFIRLVAEPELKACGANPPYAVFCDSLEVGGENWTEDFLSEFQKRRGYDLTPLLPALVGNYGPKTADIRHDYGQTVTELFNDNFNGKFTALAHKYGTRFRIQGYGSPPAALESYAHADLAEGEAGGNGEWRNFRTTRYASSADHLMGNPVASSETFTWLHRAPFRAVPLDIKGEVDTHFLDGINQMICHGWPYTPNTLAYPGGSFYAAAVFNDKNPWYVAMPDISGYMQRVSEMMREGTPGNDVALYISNPDVWATAGPGFSSMNSTYTSQAGTLDAVLDAGFNLDIWDDGMLSMKGGVDGDKLAFGKVKYPVVLLSGPRNMPLATAQKLEDFAKGGGILIAIGATPTHVPGYNATDADQDELKAIMGRLFTDAGAKGISIKSQAELAGVLTQKLAPDAAVEPANPEIGIVHRHGDGGEIYFVANTAAQKKSVKVTFRQAGMQAEIWDPLTAKVRALPISATTDTTSTVALDLEPLGSTIVVFTKRQLPAAPAGGAAAIAALDISTDWSVKFASGPGGSGADQAMPKLTSWTTLPNMANYSGVATYERKFTATADMAHSPVVVSFGKATAVQGGGGRGSGYVAALNSPVKDAAVVYINGQRAGSAWCPPFKVDVTGLLKEGENTIRIDVGNTAVNYLAKAGFPNYNYDAITRLYGNRFQPQNSNLLTEPLPSGLIGPIQIEAGQ